MRRLTTYPLRFRGTTAVFALLLMSTMALSAENEAEPDNVTLVEKYADVKVGDWVKLHVKHPKGESYALLWVAKRDDDLITLEVKEYDRGFLVSWRQLVIDKKEKKTVLIRTKDPFTREIEERPPAADEGIDEVLRAKFRRIGEERVRQKMTVGKPPVEKRIAFDCIVYKATITIDVRRFIQMWYAKEIALYPVKVNIPGLDTAIKLVACGTGRESKFDPPVGSEKPES